MSAALNVVPFPAVRPLGDQLRVDHVDWSRREAGRYSLCRAILASFDHDWSRAGFEREVSQEIEGRLGKPTAGFYMPSNLPIMPTTAEKRALAAKAMEMEQAIRAVSGTAYGVSVGSTGGGNLVATQLESSSFIEVLRNKAKVLGAGVRVLSGLVGDIQIPRQTTPTTAYWISPEGSDITEGEATFDKLSLSPKTIGAYSQVTRQMVMQSTPEIDDLVRSDLAAVMGLGVDLAAIAGTGLNGQPTGILNAAGVQSLALGGANAGGTLDFDAMTRLETLLTTANVPEEKMAYMTNAKQIGQLKTIKDSTGRYLWTQYSEGQPAAAAPGEVNGYPVIRTNQVPSNLTKGTATGLSAVILANWSEMIFAEWGALEVLPNPFGAGYRSGTIEIRALQSIDIAIRHPTAFAFIADAI